MRFGSGRTSHWRAGTAAVCLLLAGGGLAATAGCAQAQSVPVVTGNARVDKLLSEMTLEEKLALIHGTQENPATYQGQAGYIAGVPRLGIPGMRFADGPPGVLTRHPSQAETATMGVAATFSVQDAEENGVVIGREDRALGIDVSLQPFVNIDRDLEFRRAYNTFGEDPYLTSEIAVGEVKGIQSQHVMAQIKHFVGYDSPGSNIFIDDQTLHEVYLAPFEAAIRQANVASIMCSYNRLNGTFACGNEATLTKILRDEFGFKGFVTSDWGAVHAVNFINAGLDIEMPGGRPPGATGGFAIPSFFDSWPAAPPRPRAMATAAAMFGNHIPEEPPAARRGGGDFGVVLNPEKMPQALKDGTVTEAKITRAAGRVLYEMARFGYLDGMSKHEVTAQAIEANAKIIEKTGEDSAVLLKNEDDILPLKASELDRVVLIGPTAKQVDAIGINGERSVGLPQRQIGPLAAMKKISGIVGIHSSVEDDMTGAPVPASVLSHDGQPGLQRMVNGSPAQIDPLIDFTGSHALPPDSTVTWKGTLTVPHAGDYWIYLQALGTNASITLDGKPLAATGARQGGVHGDILQANQDNVVPTTDGLDNVRRAADLTAGPHAVEVSITPDTSHAPVQVRLNWSTPEQRTAFHDAAIAAAQDAQVAVVFVWTRGTPVFGLPDDQDKLVEEVAAVNPNTVVVLNTSQPVALPWLDKVKGVLEMGWPGDEGGWSTANILLGKASPAGRLPVTWAKQLTDYAATDPQHPERSGAGVDGKTTYSEGVNVGYRWFDKEKIEPLFAFGYGLSYTKFEYSGLKVAKTADGGLDVMASIRNIGKMDSDEVPQVYLGAPAQAPSGVQFPVRALVAFDRVHIPAGTSQTVTLHVAPRQLQYWSTAQGKWETAAGARTLSVGASSRDLRLSQTVE